jgi:uncharacterized BrkB/YihY/UPF0761 family membrane protein
MLISLLWDLIVMLGIVISLGLLILFFVFFICAIQVLVYAKNAAIDKEKEDVSNDRTEDS